MATTGLDILSYRGDPNLASNAKEGVIDSAYANETARQLALLTFQKNQALYQQRILDRDAMHKAIDDDKLIPDNILEQHRSLVDEKIKKVEDIYFKYGGEIMTDNAKYREFDQAKRDAITTIKQAQKWYIGVNAALTDKKTNAKTPTDIKDYDDFINSQVKKSTTNFWANPEPFVKVLDWDPKVVAQAPVYLQAVTRQDGLNDIKEQVIDIPTTLDNYTKSFLHPDFNNMFRQYAESLKRSPSLIDRDNARLEEINKTLGSKPGDKNYLTPIDYTQDTLDKIAAKVALANSEPIKREMEFSKERSQRDLGLKNIALDQQKLGLMRQQNNIDLLKVKVAAGYDPSNDKWVPLAGTGKDRYNSAEVWTKSLYNKFATLADKDGVIAITKDAKGKAVKNPFQELTADELKYMGTGSTKDNKWSILPLPIKDIDHAKIENGEIRFFDKNNIQLGQAVNAAQIATNRLNDEMVNTTGKEGYNFNSITTLYNAGYQQPNPTYQFSATNAQGLKIFSTDGTNWVDSTGAPIKQ